MMNKIWLPNHQKPPTWKKKIQNIVSSHYFVFASNNLKKIQKTENKIVAIIYVPFTPIQNQNHPTHAYKKKNHP